jgi:hypothetical protein
VSVLLAATFSQQRNEKHQIQIDVWMLVAAGQEKLGAMWMRTSSNEVGSTG